MTETVKKLRTDGILQVEIKPHSSDFIKCNFHLDQLTKKLHYEPVNHYEVQSFQLAGHRSIDMNYVSQVNCSRSIRPKELFCFAVTESGEKIFLKAKNQKEKEEWIESLLDISKIMVPKHRVISNASPDSMTHSGDSTYETTVVGGVVCRRRLMEEEEMGSSCEELNHSYSPQGMIKQGYCTKQGFLMKNWRRRFFILDFYGLTYYKSDQEKNPLKVVSKFAIIEARVSRGIYPTRENLFEVVTAERVYYIQAEDITEMNSWIEEINLLVQGGFKAPVDQSCQTSPSISGHVTLSASASQKASYTNPNVSMSEWV